MYDVIELLKEIKNKLDRIDERLSRIEEELFDEFSKEKLEKIKIDYRSLRERKT